MKASESDLQGDLGWVGLTLIGDVPPSCPGAQPVLPISHQPRQNQAEGGTAKIKVNPTQVRQEMCHPVHGRKNSVILCRFQCDNFPISSAM